MGIANKEKLASKPVEQLTSHYSKIKEATHLDRLFHFY